MLLLHYQLSVFNPNYKTMPTFYKLSAFGSKACNKKDKCTGTFFLAISFDKEEISGSLPGL